MNTSITYGDNFFFYANTSSSPFLLDKMQTLLLPGNKTSFKLYYAFVNHNIDLFLTIFLGVCHKHENVENINGEVKMYCIVQLTLLLKNTVDN